MISKLWKNKRLRSLIWLILWFIFIFVIYFGFMSMVPSDTQNTDTPTAKTKTFEDYQADLLKYNFDFKYSLKTLDSQVVYTGTMYNGEIVGYKETHLEIEKFYINNNKLYLVQAGTLVETDNSLLLNYDGYLDLNKIFNITTNFNYVDAENEYILANDGIYVKIKLTDEVISDIFVTVSDVNYELKFTNVNKIQSVSY